MEEQLVVLMDPWRNKYDRYLMLQEHFAKKLPVAFVSTMFSLHCCRLLEAHEKLQNLNQARNLYLILEHLE